ncbi:cytochrome c oxidase subunit II [Kytococcus schroeteri]|uniref:Cytochrome c oxidase subunit 2 n=2 Tax=Kytococcus schroeteri TaxID=138300 RepID=A0A2I1PAK8_9MICO|nr:cytochrome c oxidase subunit II [Kytococcus schroeteri]
MHRHPDHTRRWKRPAVLAGAATIGAMVLSACGSSDQIARGYLPEGASENADGVISFWVGMWIAALAVGILVWGLMLWCVLAYRRKNDAEVPKQFRYNVPIEILYTVVPIVMVAALFVQNVKTEDALMSVEQEPQNIVNVAGKQWSWDFNYLSDDVHDSGQQAVLTGKDGVADKLPTLYLPVNERTEFVLTSRDVIHSFWVPQFLQKLDMIPGVVNRFQVTPTKVGTYQGKCAELCGTYHSEMLFQVKVVERDEYDKQMKKLADDGKQGFLDTGYDRKELIQGEKGVHERDPKHNEWISKGGKDN